MAAWLSGLVKSTKATESFVSIARLVPVTLIVVLMSPTFFFWFLLRENQRKSLLEMVKQLIRWTYGR